MQTVLNLCLWKVLLPANLLLQFLQTAAVLEVFSSLQWDISILQRENKENDNI